MRGAHLGRNRRGRETPTTLAGPASGRRAAERGRSARDVSATSYAPAAMSMIGEYVRLTPTELDHALRDPHWAEEFVTTLLEAECDTRPETARARCHDINKTWHALDFLLRRRDFPVEGSAGWRRVRRPRW
ncbi:DUF1877 family protein [Streptomyces sp. TR02-1]|uniref:DUF1877 family protein n=1 Tax=Streptomyces sp. TR02-1 TaxID=3385977 RepID=UPI0039A0DB7D